MRINLALGIAVAALIISLYGNVITYIVANNNRQALCEVRQDVERRITNGERFLRAHPKGAFGLSRAEIQRSINDQRRTVNALQDLDCG